jgi:hypothetical protein
MHSSSASIHLQYKLQLEKLRQHPQPEVGFRLTGRNTVPAYNMQASVDAEHACQQSAWYVPKPLFPGRDLKKFIHIQFVLEIPETRRPRNLEKRGGC